MLRYLGRRADPRKLRLFGCACCRRIWDLLAEPRWRAAVDLAERFTEDGSTAAELGQLYEEISRGLSPVPALVDAEVPLYALQWLTSWGKKGASGRAWAFDLLPAVQCALNISAFTRRAVAALRPPRRRPAFAHRPTDNLAECHVHARLLHDLFGNPFRPLAVDAAWLTWRAGTVRQLARSIYDDVRFDELPILADALEEAGCTDPALLSHLRGPGPHLRGCHVLDALLGQS
jgi:hypothetical protein